MTTVTEEVSPQFLVAKKITFGDNAKELLDEMGCVVHEDGTVHYGEDRVEPQALNPRVIVEQADEMLVSVKESDPKVLIFKYWIGIIGYEFEGTVAEDEEGKKNFYFYAPEI